MGSFMCRCDLHPCSDGENSLIPHQDKRAQPREAQAEEEEKRHRGQRPLSGLPCVDSAWTGPSRDWTVGLVSLVFHDDEDGL